MKTNTASLSGLSILVIAALLIISILKIQQAYAQVDATSSDAVATSSEANPSADASTSTAVDTSVITSIDAPETGSTATPQAILPESVKPTEPPPQGLTEVHIIGTKYIDYFTDGTTITSYAGDPAIDSNFDKPNTPIPTHEGLTWVQTIGKNLYDTESGDLEVGEYAVQPNGTYITNAPPFVSSTSTPAVLGASTSAADTPTDITSTSTSTPAPTDTPAPTTTSTDSTTTTANQ
jgi:hypothetical protein